MKVIISGAGICGLTLAITAKRAGLNPIIIERSSNVYSHTFGGGIGLWPPSQLVYQQLGLLDKLRSVSGEMPNPFYLNQKGWKLGQPSRQFHKRYKILCLEREALNKILYQQCQALGISVLTGLSVIDATSYEDYVDAELSNGTKIQGQVLIGADGINSTVRSIIMRQRKLAEIKSTHCGYAYFRAVIDLSKNQKYIKEGKWHKTAFESWGQEKRFGYVPLKEPKVFWFFAVPINRQNIREFIGSHSCQNSDKQWILKSLAHWEAPISIKQLIQLTPPNFILRTDIRKIKNVTDFPWINHKSNIFIIGDAANATAPNLAQGAGLAIQSAWDLISMVNFQTGQGIDNFLARRRKRATTVQDIADMVATVGQIYQPISSIRDIVMAGTTKYIPTLQQKVFEAAVRYSLGGNSNTPHWLPSINKTQYFQPKIDGNVLQRVVGKDQFQKLPSNTKDFRQSLMGRGSGYVTVNSGILGKILSLPPPMQNERFQAYVDVSIDTKSYHPTQKWTRIFGYGTDKSTKYSTIHQATPDFYAQSPTGLTLTQTIGQRGIRKYIKFGYQVKLNQNKAQYRSNSLWIGNYRVPIPSIFLPKSSWFQQQVPDGWKFDGTISLPTILGGINLLQYKGNFIPHHKQQANSKKVIIAGGTGFIGSAVARQFYFKGWQVIILSRKANHISDLPFAKIVKWNPNYPEQQKQINRLSKLFSQADVVINLAGENPGASRWNDQTKEKIIKSRLSSIQLISQSFKRSQSKPIFIQASAAGIYGNRGSQILNDQAESGCKDTFRVQTCIQLQNLTKQRHNRPIIARIGHVFGQADGIFPFIRLSSKLRAKKFGRGGQYIPWIHVQDVANALYFMANNPDRFQGKLTNIASPDHKTYDQLYKTMGELKKRSCYFSIPEALLRIAMGELSSVVLESQRMHPQRLIEEGFKFKYQNLSTALLSKELL